MASPTFRFGRNWRAFNQRYLDGERIAMAKRSLTEFLGLPDLRGRTFLDMGAGSGLYSLAALELGAREVVSVDVDEDCIACCEGLRTGAGSPERWRIVRGSALERDFVAGLGQYDVVYSWGVLHHTGSMWQAIDNVMRTVAPRGLFYLAIYNRADGLAIYPDMRFGPSRFWRAEKRLYVSLPAFLQNCIDYAVMSALVLGYLVMLKNPVRVIRDHGTYFNKGMSWRINIKDWLGGYPYEYASVAEVFGFARARGFRLENLTCNNGLLNNEYLFVKD